MLECDYGVPGSGKSYKAVYSIYEAFVNEKSERFNKYERFYTNIADFKFNKFPDTGFKLVPNDFIKNLSTLRLLAIQGKSESEILETARSLNLLNCLVVWDEAQQFFSKQNDVLLWYIEYHRHLHNDVILIAQSPDRIQSGYKDLGDLHFKAVPPSLRMSNSLQYKRYATSKMYKKEVIDTISLKPDQKIFDLYKSGANEKPKKVIYKFIVIALVLAFVVGSIFAFVTSSWSSNDSNSSSVTVAQTSLTKSTPISSHVFTVACVGFDCSYLGQSVVMSDLNVKEKEFNIYPTLSTQISDGVYLRTYSYNADFIKGVFNVSFSDSDIN